MSSYSAQNGQHPPPAAPFTFVLPAKDQDTRAQLQRKRSREDDDGEYDIHPEYRDNYDDHNIHNASPSDMPLSIGDEDEFGGHSPVEDDFDEDEEILKQGLNSDGTPKRPMNAFMIYARRRRPEVSQDYPSLRTGEISKLLSKEWSGMSQAKKKTFLDLAKKLKDRFNLAHPEYVYKRRPNNSRKKRKNSNAHSTTPVLEQQQTVTGPVPIVASNGPEVMGHHPHGYGGYDEYHHHPHSHPHHHRSGGSLSPPEDLGLAGYALDAASAAAAAAGPPGPSGRSSRSSRMSVSSQQHPYDVAPDDPSHLYVVSSSSGLQSPHRATPNGATTTTYGANGGAYDEADFAAVNHAANVYHHHPQQQHLQHHHQHHPSATSSSVPYQAQQQQQQQQEQHGVALQTAAHHPHPHHQFTAATAHSHHPGLVHQASRESMSGPRQHRADSVNSVNGSMWASPARASHWNPAADLASSSGVVNGRRTSGASSVSPSSLDHHHTGGNLVENWVDGSSTSAGLEGLGLRPVGRHDSIASVSSSSVGRPGTAPGMEGPNTPISNGAPGWQAPSADMLSPLASDSGLGIRAGAGVPTGRPHSNSVSSAVGRPHTGSSVGSLTRPHSSSVSVMSSGGPGGRALGSFTAINPATGTTATGFEHLSSTPLHGNVAVGQTSPPELQPQNGVALGRGSWADWGANQHFQSTGNGSPNAASSHRAQPHEFSTLNSPYYPQGSGGDGSSNTPIVGHEDPANRMVNNGQQQQQHAPTNANGANGNGFHSFQNDQHDVNYHPHHAQRHPQDVLAGNGQVPGSVDAGNLYSAGTTTTSLPTTASTPPTASAPPTPDYGGPGSQSHEMIASRSMQDVASYMGGGSILAAATDAVHAQNYGLGAVDHHNPYDAAAIGGGHHHHHHFAQPVLAAAPDPALHHHHHHPAGGYWPDSVKAEPAV
ncbi:hypothetical protein FRC04_008383 [Tulasnella sp. 424]|nr:hypothetical protein FRC04_008383 [Tulasnella sp. 424]KAG8976755.1 hypothetical protein FRC05_003105 [Tulasnella sp. 425]